MEVIPLKGPAILIANHPSALMDAALIGILLKRPVYFFTKGEVFISRPVNYLLNMLHMIPIHDHEGGRATVKINEDSYIKAEKVLSKGGIILFFPEGNSKTDHKLMPLRKGVFRMAFQAAIKNNFRYDIPFIPVGINYQHPTAANKDVMIHFNNPFFLGNYKAEYEANAAAAMLRMTKDGFPAMEKKVLHVEDSANFEVTEKCLTINRNNYGFYTSSWIQATIKRFSLEKSICNRINDMEADELLALKMNAEKYFAQLKQYGLKDKTLSPGFIFSGYKRWQVIRSAPFFLIGWLLNSLPFIVGKRITDKMVTRKDFYSWVLVVTGLFLYMIWVLLLFAGFAIVGWKYALGITLFTLFTGLLYYAYPLWLKDFKQYKQLKKLKRETPQALLQLQQDRKMLEYETFK